MWQFGCTVQKTYVAREKEGGERVYKIGDANARRRDKVVFVDYIFWFLLIKP